MSVLSGVRTLAGIDAADVHHQPVEHVLVDAGQLLNRDRRSGFPPPAALDRGRQDAGLVRPVGQQHDPPGLEDRADAHRDGVHRHVLAALEEPGVVVDRLPGQGLEPRRDPSELAGSLKAMWPSVPMPSTCRSMPPHSSIRCSYQPQWASRSSARPEGT